MKKQNNFKFFIIYILVLLFGFVGLVTALNDNQIKEKGGANNSVKEKDGVSVSKIISATDTENFFDITLKVDTNKRVNEIVTDPDIAIILVMDLSYTMIQNTVSSGETRLVAAQSAAESLIDKFVEESKKTTTASRKLGIVGFNTNGHNILNLQDAKTDAQANALKKEMKNDTNTISNNDKYPSHNRFTNIEAGLQMAKDMLDKTAISNKYIILLSDGFPTTYLNKKTTTQYDGYDPYMNTNPKGSSEGKFYNEVTKKPCTFGTSYSDRAAIKARTLATTIKNSGIKIFSVGTGLTKDKVTLVNKLDKSANDFSVVDTEKSNYEIGTTLSSFHNWLKNSIGSGYYYDTNSKTELIKAFGSIFDQVKTLSENAAQGTWVAEDPMGTDGNVKNIEFVGLYDDKNILHLSIKNGVSDQSDTATYTNNKISWDLKNSKYTTSVSGGVTTYHYEIKYRVRLVNELNSFVEGKIYKTNGSTKLTYVTRVNGVLSKNKTIIFPEPSVHGFLGDFSFSKKSSYDNTTNVDDVALAGAKFKLVHDSNCTCKKGYKNMTDKKVTIGEFNVISDSSGIVSFSNIPSGHTYILSEVGVVSEHEEMKTTYLVEISNGEVSHNIPNSIIINDKKLGELSIKKVVIGNSNNSGEFKFKLVVTYNGVKIKEETISLVNNQTKVIKNLPVGATYTLKETTTDGFTVQYEVNKLGIKDGDTASCGVTNNCRIEEGNSNSVVFTNTVRYILPETGSRGMLIIMIIGILLLVVPIVYMGYSFYQNKRRRA